MFAFPMRVLATCLQDVVHQGIQSAYKTAVSFYKDMSSVRRTRFKRQTIQRYEETHNQQSPYEKSEVIVNELFEGKMQDVVLLRVTADGEQEFDVEDREGARLDELHDDGSAVVRADQQTLKFGALA